MTNLERLIKAEGVQGGTIHDYERRTKCTKLMGKSLTELDNDKGDFNTLANLLIDEGKTDIGLIVSQASMSDRKTK